MPTYVFRNNKTGKVKEEFMMISEMEKFIKDNKNWSVVPQPLTIVGGVGEIGSKLPDSFKDVLRNVKDKHPHAHGVNKVLGGDTSPTKSGDQRMKGHRDRIRTLRGKKGR